MNTKNIQIFLVIIFSVIFLNGCATGPMSKGKSKGFKHNTPLIKEDVKKTGKIEVQNVKHLLERMGGNHSEDQVKKYMEELDRADAHPYGARPFKRENYINKFHILTDKVISKKESERFLKDVQNCKNLKNGQLDKLNIEISKKFLKSNNRAGIF